MNDGEMKELKEHIVNLINHGVMFEVNTVKTQEWFRSAMNIHLSGLSDREVIRDYFVVCDSTTNSDPYKFVANIFWRSQPRVRFRILRVEVSNTQTTFDDDFVWKP